MDRLGDYYRKIRETFGNEVTINYVDPRNILTIVFYFLSHVIKRDLSIRQFLKSIYNMRHSAMYYNGYLINEEKTLGNIELVIDKIIKIRTA